MPSVNASTAQSSRNSKPWLDRSRPSARTSSRPPTASNKPGERAGEREHEALDQHEPREPSPGAPSAARTASSRRRAATRASCRFATFAHAISSTASTRGLQQQHHRLEIADARARASGRALPVKPATSTTSRGTRPAATLRCDDRRELGVQPLERRAGPQPPDARRELPAARGVARLLRRERERRPGVDVARSDSRSPAASRRSRGTSRRRAGCRGRRRSRLRAEARAPEPVAQHDDAVVAGRRLVVGEHAADRGADAQHGEQRRRRARREQALRLPSPPSVRGAVVDDREALERLRLLAPLEVVRDRGARVVEAPILGYES